MALKKGDTATKEVKTAKQKTDDAVAKSINSSKNKGEFKTFSMRLYESDIEALKEHFEEKGLKLTQGMRMVIKDFMKSEGI